MQGISPVVGFPVFFAHVLDAGGAIVAVADDAEVFEDDSEHEPEPGEENPDAPGEITEKIHKLVWCEGRRCPRCTE